MLVEVSDVSQVVFSVVVVFVVVCVLCCVVCCVVCVALETLLPAGFELVVSVAVTVVEVVRLVSVKVAEDVVPF